MLTTPYPTRITVAHAHHSTYSEWLMLTTLQAFIQEKGRLKKIKLRRKRLSFPKVWECFTCFYLFFWIWIKILNIESLQVLNCIYSKKILTIHIIIIPVVQVSDFCFFKNKKNTILNSVHPLGGSFDLLRWFLWLCFHSPSRCDWHMHAERKLQKKSINFVMDSCNLRKWGEHSWCKLGMECMQ
jgi:hypothetical protein